MRRNLPFEKPDLLFILQWCNGGEILSRYFGPIGSITRALERYAATTPIDPELRGAMTQFAARLRSSYHKLAPGEAWSDAVNDDITHLKLKERERWTALLRHALTATAARPSAKWLTSAGKLVQAIGGDGVRQQFLRWLPLVAQGQTLRRLGSYAGDVRGAGDVMNEENATCLRGLLWLVQTLPRPDELARPITAVALSAYKKVPGVGPRAVKVGNAAVYALSEMGSTDAVGQLAMLKVRVKFGTAQKEIEKAFNTAAEALGLPRDQIEEMGVPSYGLEEVGLRREIVRRLSRRADRHRLRRRTEVVRRTAASRSSRSRPRSRASTRTTEGAAAVAQGHPGDAAGPARPDRLDVPASEDLADRRVARALSRSPAGRHDRAAADLVRRRHAGALPRRPADRRAGPADRARQDGRDHASWHPVGRGIDEITAWRRRLEELGITQPFKQAHREVYLLTDAERNTRTYSNRFAAHIIRQHQFNALCAARGWKNKLRLMVDDTYPPATRELPQWGLRPSSGSRGSATIMARTRTSRAST